MLFLCERGGVDGDIDKNVIVPVSISNFNFFNIYTRKKIYKDMFVLKSSSQQHLVIGNSSP